jgi:magnesium-transporting ATPase (P-type)
MLLGHRDALAEQILARPELRSSARRFAWLLFGVMPILVTILLSVTVFGTALAVSGSSPDSQAHPSLHSQDAPALAHFLTRWVTPFGIAIVLSSIALRRRFPPLWPVIGIALTALVAAGTRIDLHQMSIGLPSDTGRAVALVCGLLAIYGLGCACSRATRSI